MTFVQWVSKAAPPPALQAQLLHAAWRLRREGRAALAAWRRVRAGHPSMVLHGAWALSVAVVVGCVLLVPIRASGAAGDATQRLLQLSGGDFSDKGFARAFALDPAAAAIVDRLRPRKPQPQSGQVDPAATVPSTQDMPGLSADQARLINAAIPFSGELSPAAKPFLLRASDVLDQSRAIDCLTAAVYYEAAGEPLAGQQAVAQVVLNRVRHPAFPKTVCGVVFEGSNLTTGCQFTFTCDGSLARVPQADAWQRARRVAAAALGGFVMRTVGDATHYHADYVVPYWATTMVKISKVGSQIFYRWTGGWGAPAAFTGQYAGIEPVVDLTGSTQVQTPALDPLADAAVVSAATPQPVVTTATVTPIAAQGPAPQKPVAATPAAAPVAKAAPAKPAPPPGPPETIAAGPLWERP
jgi:spore germination cell wall hydrolase CwlJ-like protein